MSYRAAILVQTPEGPQSFTLAPRFPDMLSAGTYAQVTLEALATTGAKGVTARVLFCGDVVASFGN